MKNALFQFLRCLKGHVFRPYVTKDLLIIALLLLIGGILKGCSSGPEWTTSSSSGRCSVSENVTITFSWSNQDDRDPGAEAVDLHLCTSNDLYTSVYLICNDHSLLDNNGNKRKDSYFQVSFTIPQVQAGVYCIVPDVAPTWIHPKPVEPTYHEMGKIGRISVAAGNSEEFDCRLPSSTPSQITIEQNNTFPLMISVISPGHSSTQLADHVNDNALSVDLLDNNGDIILSTNRIYLHSSNELIEQTVTVDLTPTLLRPPQGQTNWVLWPRLYSYSLNSDQPTWHSNLQYQQYHITFAAMTNYSDATILPVKWFEPSPASHFSTLVNFNDTAYPNNQPCQIREVSEAFRQMNKDICFTRPGQAETEYFDAHCLTEPNSNHHYFRCESNTDYNECMRQVYTTILPEGAQRPLCSVIAVDHVYLSWWENGNLKRHTEDELPYYLPANFDNVYTTLVFLQCAPGRQHVNTDLPWTNVTKPSPYTADKFYLWLTGALVHELGHVVNWFAPAGSYEENPHSNHDADECIMQPGGHHPMLNDTYIDDNEIYHYGCTSNPHFCPHHINLWKTGQ